MQCASCDKTDGLKVCGKCKKIKYCSEECQLLDWQFHKQYCDIVQRAYKKPTMGFHIHRTMTLWDCPKERDLITHSFAAKLVETDPCPVIVEYRQPNNDRSELSIWINPSKPMITPYGQLTCKKETLEKIPNVSTWKSKFLFLNPDDAVK